MSVAGWGVFAMGQRYVRRPRYPPQQVWCAICASTRSQELPDIPTVGEFVPGYEAMGWDGLGAPRNTPVEIIETLNREVNAGLSDPKLSSQLADLGATVFPGSPEDFKKHIAAETEKWGNVIRAAHIKVE